jgi:hypothetical protein
MTLWLRATKWFPECPGRLIERVPAGSDELVAQSHKGWSA